MKKIKITFVFMPIFLALFASVAFAGLTPEMPNQFWGTVTHNGQPAADGLVVTAEIDGTQVASATTLGGIYYFFVTEPPAENGDIVYLFVQGIDTGESGIFYNGGVTEIDLSVTYTPAQYCGDGSCNNGETCSTCPADCGACASGGGGGGGGYTPPAATTSDGDEENETTATTQTTDGDTMGTQGEEEIEECVEMWVCSDWSKCEDGLQERTCVEDNGCGTDDRKPFETQPCSLEEAQSSTPTGFAFLTALGGPSVLAVIGLLLAVLIGVGFKKGFIKL